MLIVISPAKTLDYESPLATERHSMPDYLDKSGELIDILSRYSPLELEKLMSISPKLAELNMDRYLNWTQPFSPENSRQAALAFKGDVYLGLQSDTMTDNQWNRAQTHLRILSGLYGLLRPLDLIQPYRLEMGTRLKNEAGKDLYDFWGTKISDGLNDQLAEVGSRVLVNLASNEYFKSVDKSILKAEIVTPVFKDWKNGEYKMISFFAKRARGLMSRWMIEHKVERLGELQKFDIDGYQYSPELSSPENPTFLRRQT